MAPPVARAADRRAQLRTLLLAVVALGVAAGCGGSGEDPAATPSPSTPEVSDAEASDSGVSDASAAPTPTTPSPTTAGPTPTSTPTSTPTPTSTVAGSVAPVLPEGFTTTVVRITEVDGDVCEVCVWLADSAEERGRGLMGVTDLGEPVGMLFVFDSAAVRSFYMLGTPTPLSIAWFGEDGGFVGSTDMSPCLVEPSGGCPLYAPDSPYLTALEVVEGGLADLGVGPGARLEHLDGVDCDRL